MLLALPAASNHSIVAGFAVLTLVIVCSLSPNGTVLALASAVSEGPALPLNLAVVCSRPSPSTQSSLNVCCVF
jgi:hypothetical protein